MAVFHPSSHPILSCAEAKAWEAGLLKDETAEWTAMQKAGAAIACALLGVGAQAREAPPRSAADVFQQLRAKGAGVHNRMSDADDARAALAEPEPAGADAPALLRYLLRRSNAHAILGDRDAQKRDLLRAMELAGADELLRYRAHGALFHFENNAGSLLAAREHARAQAAAARALRPPLQVGALTRLVYIANRLGDRAGAESAMAELDTLIRRLRRGQGWERSGEYWTSQQERARSQLQALAGDLPAAEQSAQTALAAAERYLAGLGERAATDEQRAEIASATGWIETIVRDLASTQAAQGKLLAAELTARRALQLSLKRIGFAAATTARSLQLLARTLVEQGRYVEGEQLARESLRAADAAGLEGSSHVLVLARESLGNALAMQLRWAEAERVFAERVTALDKADPALRKEVRLGNFNWALALIKTGRHERARALLETMRRRYASFGDESANARIAYCRGFLGLSYVETGLVDEALAEFRASIPVILEAAYRDLREDREGPARVARMNYILEGYMRALAEKSRAGPDPAAAAEIFRLADFARGSRVQRALTLGSARAAARDPALLRLVGEDERLLDRVTVLSGILGGLVVAPEERRLDQTINQMRLDLAQIERQRAGIRERIAREFPDYAGLVAPRPVTLDDARRALQPGEALLSLYLAEDRAYAWGLAPGRATAFAVVPVRRDEIARTGLTNFGRIPSWDVVRVAVSPHLPQETGHTLGEIARRRGIDALDAVCDVVVADRGETRILVTSMQEADVHEIVKAPFVFVGSDGNALATSGVTSQGKPHPRFYGTHARVLGAYVRDLRLLTLPAAVHKMTGGAAAALGLADRGVLRDGAWADVAVFDPARIADQATFDDPHRYAVGVSTVLVNGEVVIDGGDHTGALPGRVLRRR